MGFNAIREVAVRTARNRRGSLTVEVDATTASTLLGMYGPRQKYELTTIAGAGRTFTVRPADWGYELQVKHELNLKDLPITRGIWELGGAYASLVHDAWPRTWGFCKSPRAAACAKGWIRFALPKIADCPPLKALSKPRPKPAAAPADYGDRRELLVEALDGAPHEYVPEVGAYGRPVAPPPPRRRWWQVLLDVMRDERS